MRALRTPHQALPSFLAADALMLLRLDEAGGAVNFTDAMGVRTMTQTGSPGAALSVFNDQSQAAGRGSRTFDGATQYGGRAVADGDETLFQTRAWGASMWLNPSSLAANRVVLEYAEWSSPKTSATYIQMQISVRTDGSIRYAWHDSGGAARNNSTPVGVLVVGQPTHFGIAVEPDPDNHLQQRIRFYVNGECVSIVNNRPPPFGGASSRWIVGGSRDGGAAVGTPGNFYPGTLDDVIITKFSPKHEFFREVYANGVCSFYEKMGGGASGIGPAGPYGGNTITTMQEVHTRVLVEVSPDGTAWPDATTNLTLRNLTDLDLTDVGYLHRVDLVKRAEWGDHIDDIGPSAAVTLVPRFFFWNISPATDTGPLCTLFQKRRRIKIEQAFVPVGTTRDGADPYYRLMFDGWAMNPEIAGKDGNLMIHGPHGPLLEAWVEPEPIAQADELVAGDRAYGSGGGTALQTVIQNIIDDHDPAKFSIIPATGAEGNPNGIDDTGAAGQIQIRVFGTADEHGKGRPHPVQNGDSLLVEGTVNFNGVKTANASTTTSVIQVNETGAFAAEQVGTVSLTSTHSYHGGKPTLWCPTAPGWNLFTFNEPPTKAVMTAIQAWADEIGWHCRFRWDDTRKEFRLKLYDPRVSPSTPIVFSDDVYPVEHVSLQHDFQRTAGVVEYASNANTDNRGERTRYCVGYGELARNGDRYYFRVVNDSKSLVTDSTTAQKQLDAIKADLGTSPASDGKASMPFPADPRWDLGDGMDFLSEYGTSPSQMPSMIGFEAFPVVNGVTHTVERNKRRTTLELGKFPGGGTGVARRAHHHSTRIAPIGRQRGLTGRSPTLPAAPTVTNLAAINGVRFALVEWSWPVGDQNRFWEFMEVHYSTTSNFTPSSATLKAVVRGTQTILRGFVAATTYRVRCVAIDGAGNRSQPSAQTSFVS